MALPRVPAVRPVRRVVLALAVLAATVTALAPATPAAAAPSWFDGSPQITSITNCITWNVGPGMNSWVGYRADPEAGTPVPGQVYYVHVVAGAVGNPCAGQIVWVWVTLPPNTSPAISAANPVYCYRDGAARNCPQSLGAAGGGKYFAGSGDAGTDGGFLMPFGSTIEIQIPVVSSSALTNAALVGEIGVADGDGAVKILHPQAPVTVFSSEPAMVAPSPSTELTQPTWPTGIRSEMYLYPRGQGGNAYFELRTAAGGGGSPVFTDGPAAVPGNQQNAYTVWTDWTTNGVDLHPAILPNTTYYWRMRYTTQGGTNYFSPEQSFTTPPANTAVVGTGTAASCTGPALASAVATGQPTVMFDCGADPATIQLTGPLTLAGPRTIDGGGTVTLRAASGQRLFTVSSGTVVLDRLTLTGGGSTGCGGAVLVTGGATLDLERSSVSGNSAGTGGGVCVAAGSTALVYSSSVSGNTATTYGGGLFNSGNVEMRWSELSDNTAGQIGGGGWIEGSGWTDITYSTVAANDAGVNAGGLRVSGNASVAVGTSTISGNRANDVAAIYASSSGSHVSLSGATVADNTSTGAGGANLLIQGASVMRNTLLVGNVPATCFATARPVSYGYNLEQGATCGLGAAGDRPNTAAGLLPLADWGGSTRTHALAAGSASIDAGDSPYCGQFDQRGVGIAPPGDIYTRSIDGDGNGSAVCDIGAYEAYPDGDTDAPRASAVIRADANPVTSATARWTVAFTETVTGVGTGDFQLVGTGVNGGSVTSVTPAGAANVFTVTAAVGNGVGTLRLDLLDDDSIRDAVNRPLAGSSSADGARSGQTYDIDRPAGTTTTTTPTSPTTTTTTIPGGGGGGGGGGTTTTVPDGGAAPAAGIVPVAPARFLDTRPEPTFDSQFSATGRLGAGGIARVQIAGRGSVPGGAAGVVANLTVIGPDGPGFATLYPCSDEPPQASHINYFTGDVLANNAVVPLSAGGEVCIYSSAGADYALDVNGFVPAGSPVTGIAPARYLDTRDEPTFDGEARATGPLLTMDTIEVQIAGRGGVPADATAALVNLTVIAPNIDGFATVFPCGPRPETSSLNFAAGSVTPNGALTRLSPTGSVCIYTYASADVALDVSGYVASGATSVVARPPARFLDTRPEGTVDGESNGTGRLTAGGTVEVQVAGRDGIPAGATAAVLNLAIIAPDGPGYATLYPCGAAPTASNLNHAAGGIVRANNAVTKLSPAGTVCIYTLAPADFVLDVTGYLTG